MIEEFKVWARRKGQLSSVPITQIIKIVLAVLVASTILAIFIPIIFRGMDQACVMLKDLVNNLPVIGDLNQNFGFITCNG